MKYLKYLAVTLLLCTLLASTASADYYIANDFFGPQAVSKTYEVNRLIDDYTEIGDLTNPMDLFIDQNDYTYLLDQGNTINPAELSDPSKRLARVIVYTPDDKVERIITGVYGKDQLPMNKPEGLFVDELGDIFIADTQNGRILHLDKNGNFVEEFFEPDHPTYDKSYSFKPTKVAVDEFGRIYITNAYDYHGIILLDGRNEFLGYIASTKIEFSLTDRLVRLFASEEQQAQLAKEVPEYFSNFLLHDNFIYATSYWGDQDQIRKLTPAGGNVFPAKIYGETNESDQFNYKPAFVDLAVDRNGIVYVADFVTGKVYVYDGEGNNLAVFGGRGNHEGGFDSISSIAVNSKGEVYVLDRVRNVVQIFRPTELMNHVITATNLFFEGKYEEAKQPWNEVLKLDTTNYLASMGLAKIAYRENDYSGAMKLYEDSLDTQGYSEAFYGYRLALFRQYFLPIVLAAIVVIILAVYAIKRLKLCADEISDQTITAGRRMGFVGNVKLGLLVIFHPLEAFQNMKKNRRAMTLLPPALLLLVMMAFQLIYINTVHLPLSDISLVYADLWQQLGLIFLPLVCYLIVGYFIISLSDGKQTFTEMVTASMYSFLPYILLILPLSLLSHAMCLNESGLYYGLVAGLWIWSLILLLISIKTMNEYSFGKLVWTVCKILFGILCVLMIVALLYIIVFQSFNLVKSIYQEIAIGSV